MLLDADASAVTLTSGTVITAPELTNTGSGSIKDSNGNYISVTPTAITDTLGLAALTIAGSPNPTQFSYTGPQGAQNITISYSPVTIKTNFGCAGINEYPATGASLPTRITLPDGTYYSIAYEPTPGFAGDVTGRIQSITLPAGGTITYTYTGNNYGISCVDGSTIGVSKTTPDTGSNSWQYTRAQAGSNWQTTIADPAGNQTVATFRGIYELQRKIYTGTATSGTLLTTIDTCYNAATPDGSGTCLNTTPTTPFTQVDTYKRLPSTSGVNSKTTTRYDSVYSRLVGTDEYDFGGIGGAVGSLIREKTIVYANLGNNIKNRPSQVTICGAVCNGSNAVAQNTYTYDAGTPTPTSGTPQHSTVSGARGNPTQISFLVQSGATLNKAFTYYDTGGVNTATDVNNAVTTYTFSDSTQSCGNSFPTNVQLPLSLTRSMTWNCNGGVQTGATDENGKSTSVTYNDAHYWRPTASTDAANNQSNYSYTTTTAESNLTFNSGNSVVDKLVTLDSLGRPHVSQTKQGPTSSTYDSVETDYDALGRAYKSSMPYAGTAGQAAGVKFLTQTFDGANRPAQMSDAGGGTLTFDHITNSNYNDMLLTLGPAPAGENTKQRQFEYDGAGRLASVCELSSSAGGVCGQTSNKTGFWTKYTYNVLDNMLQVVQNQQSGSPQNRTYTYDGLGRMTSEANPESGTTSYVYDSVGSGNCAGTFNGDLIKRTDAVGNVTCYAYDALHRVTSITYPPAGPYANVTPAKSFTYDTATVNGVVMVNAKGRLAEAYTSGNMPFLNTDFEKSSSLPPPGWTASGATLSYDTTTQYAGARSLKTAATTLYGGAVSPKQTGFPGRQYTVSGYVKSDGTCQANIQLMFLDVNSTYLGGAQTGNDTQTSWHFVTATGVAPANTAYTLLSLQNQSTGGAGVCEFDNISATGVVTDEGFNYSVRGELTDVYEATPNSVGYYHTTASFFENGAIKTLAGIPGQTTFTYGVDSEGRTATAVQGSTNLVSATTFNEASQPRTVTLGLGDSDSYGYDPNTGRMTSYTFTVGSTPKSIVGNLTWNANGTLSQLAITDGFNAGGTQTCKYGDPGNSIAGYDDLGRLIKVDCGASVWQQNFSYDAFGNLRKDVPTGGTGIAWNPGYDATNNHYTLTGTSYDYNGNLLRDTFHTYTWDAEGHPATYDSSACGTNGTCATYDAFGRIVEKNVAGVFTEFLYSPVGKLGLMNSQTLVNLYIPLPGGATYNAAPGYARFWHKDWLGTVRLSSMRANRSVDYDRAFAPFGESYKNFGSTTNYNFTGDTQDTIAGTYDTIFRELNPSQGRWLSPDPAGIGVVDPTNPQSWNQYVYTGNSPLSRVDPLGMDDCYVHMGGETCTNGNGGDGGYLYNSPAFGIPFGSPNSYMDHNFMPGALGQAAINSGAGLYCSVCGQNRIVGANNQILQYHPPTVSTSDDGLTIYLQIGGWSVIGTIDDSVGVNSDPIANNEPQAANNGSWLQKGLDYLKNHPVFISVNEIVAGQVTVQWSTKTVCGNLGAGASVPPSKAVTVGVYNNGNMSNWTNVLSSWGYSFGANLIAGYAMSTNSSGTIGGPSISGVGLSGSYTYGGCMTIP